jgi:CheY-like chemotaxis protein
MKDKKLVKVLHVDDEENELKFTKLFLEDIDPNMKVFSVIDPLEALEILRVDNYDIVLSDYKMKYLTGLELAKEIRCFTDIPIILYTGYGSEEISEKAFKVGIDGYVRKGTCPSQYYSLAYRVRKVFENYRTRKLTSRDRDSSLQVSLSS